MQHRRFRVDVTRVSGAVYVRQLPGGATRRRAQAPPPPPPKAQIRVSWREPETWIAVLLALTALVIVAQHPIARAIGTESPVAARVLTAPTAAGPQRPVTTVPSARPRQVAPVVRHAPLDPFRALVSADGALRAPQSIRMPGMRHWVAGPSPKTVAARHRHRASLSTGSAACPATHVVAAGESLWSIAQDNVKATGHAGWEQLYQANRSVVGANPDQLAVGTRLCLSSAGRSP